MNNASSEKLKFAPAYRDTSSPSYQEILAVDPVPARGMLQEYQDNFGLH
jgi:hypothetical protein